MKNINKFIAIGTALGRQLLSVASRRDRALVMRWLSGNQRAKGLVESIGQNENIEQRRLAYGQCDTQAAWQSVTRKATLRKSSDSTLLIRRRTLRIAIGSIAAALLIASTITTLHQYREHNRVMNSLAQIRPNGTKAMLYTSNGRAVELTEQSIGATLEGITISENSLEYTKKRKAGIHQMDEVITPRGCEYSLTLVDGTKVWLNAESRLRYFTDTNSDTRLVYAQGEIYFEVAPDAKHPFVVISGKQRIEVLGTSFNLNCYSPVIETTLIHGSIAINRNDTHSQVRLKAGEQSRFNSNADAAEPIEIASVDTDMYTAWRDGTFVFEQATLDVIMESLSRWYDFRYSISPRLRSLRFSGQFPRYEDLDKVISILLSTGSGITIELSEKTITMT